MLRRLRAGIAVILLFRAAVLPAQDENPAVGGGENGGGGGENFLLVDTDGAVSQAVYNGRGPRYWKQPDLGRVALQWDEAGRLVRMAGTARDGQPLDYRYQYKFDGQGAWTERMEVRMTPGLDALIPVPGDSFRRTVEYR